MKNQIDINDLAYVEARYGKVVATLPCPQDKKTGKINPQTSMFAIADKKDVVSVFHVKPIYYEHRSSTDTDLVFRPMYEVCEHYGNHSVVFKYEKLAEVHPRFVDWLNKRMKLIGGKVSVTSPFSNNPVGYNFTMQTLHYALVRPMVGLTTTTVYPDPDPESTTVDGFITSGYYSTMALAVAATSGDGANPTSPFSPKRMFIRTLRNASGYYLGRTFFLFDTSAIGDSDTITDGVLSLYGLTNDFVNANSTRYVIVSSSPASNTDLVVGDFDQVGSTSYASINLASLSQTAYNDFTLDSNGRGNISKTGVSKFGGRSGLDFDTGTMSSGNDNIFAHYEADATGTANDPKLVVTHSSALIVTPAAQVAAFSIPTYTVKRGVTRTPSAQVAAFSVPAYTVKISETIQPSVQVATFSIPVYAILGDGNITVQPAVQSAAFSVPSRTVTGAAIVLPVAQVATLSIPSYSLNVQRSIVIAPAVQVLTFSIPTLAKVGGVWSKVARATSAIWSKRSFNDD